MLSTEKMQLPSPFFVLRKRGGGLLLQQWNTCFAFMLCAFPGKPHKYGHPTCGPKKCARSETPLFTCDGDGAVTGLSHRQSALRPGVGRMSQLTPHVRGYHSPSPTPALQGSAPEASILASIAHMCLPSLTFTLEETHHFHLSF